MNPLRPLAVLFLGSALASLSLTPIARADFAADIRTSISATAPNFTNRLYSASPATLAPAGTRIWFVVDRNGDGVPQNPQPGAILGADDFLALEDVVPGSLPATFPGRFNRSGHRIPDDSLKTLTNVFVYLWDFSRPLAEVPHYDPPAGARFGLERVAATPQPDVGNATWRVVVDVFADARTVGGGTPAPPVITSQPEAAVVALGQPASFGVTVTGTPPFNYQWQKDGVDVPGATGATYGIPAVAVADAGRYAVVVSNDQGSVTSDAATLTVQVPPVITVQPAGATVPVGQAVQFSVTATGTPPLAFQWRRDGSDLPGQDGPVLDIAAARPADQGTYTVRVANAVGEAISDPAVLAVVSGPMAPVLGSPRLAREGGVTRFSFDFATEPGRSYRVQAAPALSAGGMAWVDREPAVAGSGNPATFTEVVEDGLPGGSGRLFRVVVVP